MPDFDFDAFNHDNYDENQHNTEAPAEVSNLSDGTLEETAEIAESLETPELLSVEAAIPEVEPVAVTNHSNEEVDKW